METEQIVQPGRTGAFLEGNMQIALQTVDELQSSGRFGLQDGFHNQLAGGIQYPHRDRCLMNIQLNILAVIPELVPFCR